MTILERVHTRFTRRQIDRMENIIIAVLVCTALFLVGKTGLFQAVRGQDTGLGGAVTAAGVQDTELSRGTPVALMTKAEQGRCAVQYDPATANALYADGLRDYLIQTVAAAGDPDRCSEESWQQAVTQGENWVYYDFLYNVSFDPKGKEEGRCYLVTAKDGWAQTLYYYDQGTGEYGSARVRAEQVAFPVLAQGLTPNGGGFVFEDQALKECLPGRMLLSDNIQPSPVYQGAGAPVDSQVIMTRLGFESRSSSIYESVDSTVIREGADTLRVQNDGTVSFHGPDTGDSRFQAATNRHADLQVKAEAVLSALQENLTTQAEMLCQSVETLADGSVELTYCWMLDGARVQLWEDGWAARFVFQGAGLTSFEVHLRQYQATSELTPVLPLTQAAAAADTLGYRGMELQLCYRDDGSGSPLTADWVVREPGT